MPAAPVKKRGHVLTTTKLKIALTADPELPVPPTLYGGIERIIDMLARGLVRRGHEVTLFAHAGSQSAGDLVKWRGTNSRNLWDTVQNATALWRQVQTGKFDIVHSFSRIAYLTPILTHSTPKLMSYQREISRKTTKLAHDLARGSLEFSAISDWMIEPVNDIGTWHMIPNGVDLAIYDFVPSVPADAPFVFLGRIEEIKGPHLAIEIAKRTNRKLVIAGNIPSEKQAWVDAHVLPHVDGAQITYVGPVNDAQKNKLLGQAAAFLMPILWEEPFGIVMAEALACGTPVIGLKRGAVPEVVEDGISGIVRNTLDELVEAIQAPINLSRQACRSRAETAYSESVIVDQYAELYQQMVAKRGHS